MAGDKNTVTAGARVVRGLLLIALCLIVALSLFSYDWHDISLLDARIGRAPSNLIGPVGAWTGWLFFMLAGASAYLIPLLLLGFGLFLVFDQHHRMWPKVLWTLVMLFAAGCIVELRAEAWESFRISHNIADVGGVLCGLVTKRILLPYFSPVGTGILMYALFLISFVMTIGTRNLAATGRKIADAVHGGHAKAMDIIEQKRETAEATEKELRAQARMEEKARRQEERELRRQEKEERRLEKERLKEEREAARERERIEKESKRKSLRPLSVEPAPMPVASPEDQDADDQEGDAFEKAARAKARRKRKPTEDEVEISQSDTAVLGSEEGAFCLPPMSLLDPLPPVKAGGKPDVGRISDLLVETLMQFGIEVEVAGVESGPVVTRYELRPAPGVKIEKITGLSNNIALSLKAHSVRVQAPVPGKGVVGIEIPNPTTTMVFLREILEGPAIKSGKIKVPLILGQDVGGKDLVADLADMPHMLVAGATGAGKTVCMNSMLAGLLMTRTPDQLKLILVDPKIVEFSGYNRLPHLVSPVVTDPKKVALSLRWAIAEMEKRYKLFAKAGVRNIAGYNSRVVAKQTDMFGSEDAAAEQTPELPPTVPYIVIVIDELADLMLADGPEIENCIARLAQLSRAVGIHMILSTQRPSVNVITGTIKANLPARIAFQVAQSNDSRTILDSPGAEKLLGKGDMLFLPPGTGKLVRAQGAMTTDAEIKRVVDFIKAQGEPEYVKDITQKLTSKTAGKLEHGDEDDMLGQAIEIIKQTQRASTSSLQRRLRIGYTRAARIIDILEERGIIGPPRGSDPREILIDLDGEIPNNSGSYVEGGE